jgi:hypothetical protein
MILKRQCLRPDEIPADVPITPFEPAIPFGVRVAWAFAYTFVVALIAFPFLIMVGLAYDIGHTRGNRDAFDRGTHRAAGDCAYYGKDWCLAEYYKR